MVEENYRLARKYYSYDRLRRELHTIINSILGD